MSRGPEFTLDQLVGRTRSHLRELGDPRCALHNEVAPPYLAMQAAAAAAGIELVAFSSFRDFDRQLDIWNGKFRGARPLLGRDGQPLDAARLTAAERVAAICWWSALPGTSRHHWGTDFDVMDAAAVPAGYRLQVVPAEYAADGPFSRLTTWLDAHMHAFGFFRPYATDRGGVRPEPWHLSYAPVAARAQAALTAARLREVLLEAQLDGKEEVLASLDAYFERYVRSVDDAPRVALLSPPLG
jgi:LAS superfamily LD-carboxypeptidase LdcB